ncbi:hypothetical protein G6F35_018153 [Rhizopus arrhizus]|nr:hypothetical protein G6F35_018153 [Rhizopus arrhizus]
MVNSCEGAVINPSLSEKPSAKSSSAARPALPRPPRRPAAVAPRCASAASGAGPCRQAGCAAGSSQACSASGQGRNAGGGPPTASRIAQWPSADAAVTVVMKRFAAIGSSLWRSRMDRV